MKKKADEDLSMFEDAKQFVCLLVPHTVNSIPNALKKINANKPKFVHLVNREAIKKFAVENQLNMDMSNPDPKTRKELEINEDIMAKSLKAYLVEENLNQKRAKKLDQENAAKPKKETKKEAVQETVVEAKQYTKQFDQLFVLYEYPATREEFEQLSHNQQKVDSVVRMVENLELIESQLAQEMGSDVENEEEVQKPDLGVLDDQTIANLRAHQNHSKRFDILRDVFVQEQLYDENVILQRQEDFADQVYEEMSHLSIEKESYLEWLASKKEISIRRQTRDYPTGDLEQQIFESSQREKELDEENEERQKGFAKKKKTDQDVQDDETFAQKKQEEQELRGKLNQQIQQIIKSKDEKFLKYYKHQLDNIQDEHVTPGVLLECILDDLIAEKQSVNDQQEKNAQTDMDFVKLEQFLSTQNSLFSQAPSNKKLEQQKDVKEEEEKEILINHSNLMQRKTQSTAFHTGDQSSERESMIINNIQFPGVNRNEMPTIPEISVHLQKQHLCENLAFFEGYPSYQVYNQLYYFNKMCEKFLAQEQDFSDRVYVERLDEETLKQKIYQTYLQEKQFYSQYNPLDDALYLVISHKMVQGRVRRQKQQMDWLVLPNFETYLKLFKNSPQEIFYEFDYVHLGNLSVKTKNIMPNNDGIMRVQKLCIGNQKSANLKVQKENVTFTANQDNFNSIFTNGTRVFCEMRDNSCLSTLTQKNGLMVQFLPNFEVLQSFQHSTQTIDEQKRLVLGKGSVIKYMKDGSVVILFANGNVSKRAPGSDEYVTINNKGLCSLSQKIQLEDISSLKKKDHENTKADVLIREDQVQVINYPDGTRFTQHSDGTQILTKPDGTIVVEHEQYATVAINQKNKTQVIDFFDRTQTSICEDQTIIELEDGTCFKVEKNGQIKLSFADGTDYSVSTSTGEIRHADSLVNKFCISKERQEVQIQSVQHILNEQQENGEQVESADSSENEFIPEYLKEQPLEKQLHYISDKHYQPILIRIKNNEATEFISKTQLHNYQKQNNEPSSKSRLKNQYTCRRRPTSRRSPSSACRSRSSWTSGNRWSPSQLSVWCATCSNTSPSTSSLSTKPRRTSTPGRLLI